MKKRLNKTEFLISVSFKNIRFLKFKKSNFKEMYKAQAKGEVEAGKIINNLKNNHSSNNLYQSKAKKDQKVAV